MRRTAPDNDVPPPAAQPCAPPLVVPADVLYSIAFTWPDGASWSHTQRSGRNGPGWYADRITELVARRADGDAASFVIHVHGALCPRAREALLSRWRDAFERARHPATGSDARLEMVVCDEARPAMWPTAMRVAPLMDDASGRVVICIDVHDDPVRQAAEIDALLQQMRPREHTLGLTAWPGYDLRSSFPRDDPTIAPAQVLRIDHRGAEEGVAWHLDCGLLISLPGFRRELRELEVPTYAAHMAYCGDAFAYDAERGTDEMMLEMYLLGARPASAESHLACLPALLRERASLRAHRLHPSRKLCGRRVHTWPRVLEERCPVYAPQPRRSMQFVYDEQCIELSGTMVPLEWRTERPPRRARRGLPVDPAEVAGNALLRARAEPSLGQCAPR